MQFVLQFAVYSVLSHLLGPREFGIVGMATILTNFIERVGFLGVGQALVQREQLSDSHIRCAYLLCLIFGAALFSLFYTASPWIAVYFEEPDLTPVLRVVSFSFVLACVAEVPLSLLQREMRFKELMVVSNISFLIGNGIVGIILALLGFSYWSLVISLIAVKVIRLVLAFRARPQRLSRDFTFQEVRDLLGIGFGFSLGRLTNYIALVGDEFVTGKMLGASALGLYSRSYQLMTAPAIYFGQILEKVLFSALSQKQSEKDKVSKYFLYGVELCSLVSTGGAIMLGVAAHEIIIVLFGKQWLEATASVQILALGVFFRTCYKNSDTVIRALGAVYRLAYRQAIYAAVVVVGTIVGSRWGIEGISWAVLFAVFLNYAVLSILCLRLLNMRWATFAAAHYPAIFIGVFQLASLYTFFNFARERNWNSLLSLVVGTVVEGIVTLAALAISPKFLRPKVFTWIGRNIPFQRLGPFGAPIKDFILR